MHVATIGRWRAIVRELFAGLRASGLYDRTARLFVGVVGPEVVDFEPPDGLADGRTEVVYRSPDAAHFEFPTLDRLHAFCGQRPDARVYYLHTKGAFRDSPATADWRAYMLHAVAHRHPDCLAALADHDTCGVDWAGAPWPHYSG
ncbi:MAG TPA: hypothetical protein VF796_18455, partial [Humisphaera sp.]